MVEGWSYVILSRLFLPWHEHDTGPSYSSCWSHPTALPTAPGPMERREKGGASSSSHRTRMGKGLPCLLQEPFPSSCVRRRSMHCNPACLSEQQQGAILYGLESLNPVHVKGQNHKWLDCRWVLDPALCFDQSPRIWAQLQTSPNALPDRSQGGLPTALQSTWKASPLWLSQFSP